MPCPAPHHPHLRSYVRRMVVIPPAASGRAVCAYCRRTGRQASFIPLPHPPPSSLTYICCCSLILVWNQTIALRCTLFLLLLLPTVPRSSSSGHHAPTLFAPAATAAARSAYLIHKRQLQQPGPAASDRQGCHVNPGGIFSLKYVLRCVVPASNNTSN